MSIATRTGDQGETGLMYNRRVLKVHARVEAYGAVDELNAALGWARTQVREPRLAGRLREVQEDLIPAMGELATLPEDRDRYRKDGYSEMAPNHVERLDRWLQEVEGQLPKPKGWALPGETAGAAALDVARAGCRRAERRVCGLISPEGEALHPLAAVYLNRLADLLWLWARAEALEIGAVRFSSD